MNCETKNKIFSLLRCESPIVWVSLCLRLRHSGGVCRLHHRLELAAGVRHWNSQRGQGLQRPAGQSGEQHHAETLQGGHAHQCLLPIGVPRLLRSGDNSSSPPTWSPSSLAWKNVNLILFPLLSRALSHNIGSPNLRTHQFCLT